MLKMLRLHARSLRATTGVVVCTLIIVLCSACSDDPVSTDDNSVRVSDDPAIDDPSLELVVKPGFSYRDIAVQKMAQDTPCETTEDGTVQFPDRYVSKSDCVRRFKAANGEMEASSFSLVVHKLCAGTWWSPAGLACPNPWIETTTTRASLAREFVVGESSGEERVLNAKIRFNQSWLGRLVSFSPAAEASYEIKFLVADLTDRSTDIRLIAPKKTARLGRNLLSSVGIDIPSEVEGYENDTHGKETWSGEFDLITGHRYKIEYRLILSSKSGLVAAWAAGAWFGAEDNNLPEPFMRGFTDGGFVKWTDITITVDP